jgi:hypothetical protein
MDYVLSVEPIATAPSRDNGVQWAAAALAYKLLSMAAVSIASASALLTHVDALGYLLPKPDRIHTCLQQAII